MKDIEQGIAGSEAIAAGTKKFSQFTDGDAQTAGDIVVGLRGGVNTQFDSVMSTIRHFGLFLAGPATAPSAAPSFRGIAISDLPVGVFYIQGKSAFSDITNGDDTANSLFASIVRPLKTIAAAQTFLANVGASGVRANFIAPGTYAESGTLAIGANVFVTGSDPQDCIISATINLTGSTWNVNADLRSGFVNCNLTGSLLFNFTSQTNNAQGRIYLQNCLTTNPPVMTAQNTANQLNIKDSTLTGGITAVGGAVTSLNNTCNGNVNVSSSGFADTSYTAKSGTMAGNYVFTSTGGNAITVNLFGVGTSSTTTLTATGNVTIIADYLSLPAQANITLSGGATLQIVSTKFFDNTAVASVDVQSRHLLDSSGNTQLDWSAGTASAVNYLKVTNAETTASPKIIAAGSDNHININLKPKGAGIVQALDGSDSTKILALKATGANTSTTTVLSATSTADRTISLPDATGTLLINANNLSDVSNANTSLQNLGVYSSISVTIGGAFQFGFRFVFVRGMTMFAPGDTGTITYTAVNGPCLYDFIYFENSPANLTNKVTSLTFNDLEGVANSFSPSLLSSITSLSAPNLQYVGLDFNPSNFTVCTSISLASLARVGGAFTPATMPLLTTLSIPSLQSVGSNSTGFAPSTMAALTTLSAPALTLVCGNFAPTTMAALTTFNFPLLNTVIFNCSPSTMGSLTSMSFPALVNVGGTFSPTTMASLTTLSAAALVTIGGSFAPTTMASLTSMTFTLLASVNNFSPTTMGALTTLSFPALTTVNGTFNPSSMALLTSMSFPVLATVFSTFTLSTFAALTSVAFDAITNIGSTITFSSMASLTTVSFAGMVTWNGSVTMTTGLGNITTITLGTIGTLKSALNFTITGQKLNSASVNAILALLVSLDGTNGTTTWGAGRTLNISGGTSAAPSGQGIVDKATLQGRGATVTTN